MKITEGRKAYLILTSAIEKCDDFEACNVMHNLRARVIWEYGLKLKRGDWR